jgi:hypothetical protein
MHVHSPGGVDVCGPCANTKYLIQIQLTTYLINFDASDLLQIVQNSQLNDKGFVQPTQYNVLPIKKAKMPPSKALGIACGSFKIGVRPALI